MIDLEREVKEVLDRRGEEATALAGDRIPAEVSRRVRQRQARTVIMSGLAAALVAIGALAGARALVPTVGREPGTEAPTPPFPIGPNSPTTVIASDEFRGLEWKLYAGRDGETWCVELEARTKRGGQSIGSCERDQNKDLVATALHTPGFPAVVVGGFVSREVDRVVFDFDAGGQIAGTVYPTPEEMKASFDVFVIVIPEERPARGAVMALDADREVLAQLGVYATRGLFGLEDAYGNFVGYIPAQPPLWEEWAEPGTPATMERIESIRHAATFPLRNVRPEIRDWWERRPPPEAPDDAFLDWWASYPVTERTAD